MILSKLEIGLLTVFWNNILQQVNIANVTIQNHRLDVNTAVALVKSLKSSLRQIGMHLNLINK